MYFHNPFVTKNQNVIGHVIHYPNIERVGNTSHVVNNNKVSTKKTVTMLEFQKLVKLTKVHLIAVVIFGLHSPPQSSPPVPKDDNPCLVD